MLSLGTEILWGRCPALHVALSAPLPVHVSNTRCSGGIQNSESSFEEVLTIFRIRKKKSESFREKVDLR